MINSRFGIGTFLFPQIMSNNLRFPTKRRILLLSKTCNFSNRTFKLYFILEDIMVLGVCSCLLTRRFRIQISLDQVLFILKINSKIKFGRGLMANWRNTKKWGRGHLSNDLRKHRHLWSSIRKWILLLWIHALMKKYFFFESILLNRPMLNFSI